jgi:hypothetical protein
LISFKKKNMWSTCADIHKKPFPEAFPVDEMGAKKGRLQAGPPEARSRFVQNG